MAVHATRHKAIHYSSSFFQIFFDVQFTCESSAPVVPVALRALGKPKFKVAALDKQKNGLVS